MEDTKRKLVEKLQGANNILVTVSTNPSVDQLTALLGLTLWLNKADKRAVAIFSGNIPNALEFLQPEATIEKTADSLRDFIIALDKSKADKLRYKVEDRVVKIFITPYRTSLSSEDLEFSQGDFNVDAVVALGVGSQADLDNAITAHGRILHDAAVITINNSTSSELGSINWLDSTASCLSELAYDLGKSVAPGKVDPQIATALLTGVVATTDRFSNELTTPHTMTIAAELMSAGANQQLVVNKLETPAKTDNHSRKKSIEDQTKPDKEADSLPPEVDNGTLEIKRDQPGLDTPRSSQDNPVSFDSPATPNRLVIEPPTLGSALNANDHPENLPEPSTDPLSLPAVEPNNLARPTQSDDQQTLSQIEQSVDSPHLSDQHIDDLRDQVQDALKSGPEPLPKPTEALNAVNVDLQTPSGSDVNESPLAFHPDQFEASDADESTDLDVPPQVPPPVLPPDFLPPAPPAE